MALSAFSNILLVSSTCAIALLVCIGVCGCGCVFVLMKRAPSSASATDDLTAQIICEVLRIAPLLKGMSSFPAMNMCPPVQLQDFGLDTDDALPWIAKTMLLAQ
jgi:hypothetical protein